MTPERCKQIEKLYHTTLNREAHQRSAFLQEACAGNEALRREVESLLAQQEQGESFIETPALVQPGFVFVRVIRSARLSLADLVN
jgi:hypothetical protein